MTRSRHRSAFVLLLACVSLLAAACGGGGPAARPPSAANDRLGHLISLALPTDEGSLLVIPNGRTVVLDFFGPTCVPCKEKVPALHAKAADLKAKGAHLVLVGVVADGESTGDAKKALNTWGVHAPFLVDREGASMRDIGITSLPATVIVDATGKVVWVARLDATAEDVVAAVP